MIQRYSTPEMTRIWSEENIFQQWLDVELAVLDAKADLRLVDPDVPESIRLQARLSVERIHELDRTLHHDLLAFVQTVQESLDPELRPYFHADLTSYDTEEPATGILFRESLWVLIGAIETLIDSLRVRAMEYQHLPCIERTHGQHAEPSVFGLKFLIPVDQLDRQLRQLKRYHNMIAVGKISGAVGTYGRRLSPQLERLALLRLGLRPAKVSGQIIFRDRHAMVLCTVAAIASIIENLAMNLRLLAQTEVGEVQEPFGEHQKGSSKMPHKKNPVLSENLSGLARVVRANASVAMENITTWGARDISHSSAERIIFQDSFQLVHFMLLRVTKVVCGLVAHPDRITANLDLLRGVIFSGEIKDALLRTGMDPDRAYRLTQEAAFKAIAEGRSYESLLREAPDLPEEMRVQLAELMRVDASLHHVPEIFLRFALPVKPERQP